MEGGLDISVKSVGDLRLEALRGRGNSRGGCDPFPGLNRVGEVLLQKKCGNEGGQDQRPGGQWGDPKVAWLEAKQGHPENRGGGSKDSGADAPRVCPAGGKSADGLKEEGEREGHDEVDQVMFAAAQR